ncbi:putative transcription factor interactor and regulator C3H-WRC/GRF family [Helianthus annuus]|nr:putative transcription factor interactor and regulator C3H-WRC/GRF family [Helianthus annuus]
MSSNEYSTENVGCRNEKSGKAPSQAAECDVGLALNMLNPETTHPKKMNFIFDPSLYNHSQHRASIDFGGGSGGGGRLLFDNSMATSSHIVSGTSFSNPTGGGEMQKMLFTASQLQEFENQTMIYKHIMSSNPIPPQMLLPLSTQYNSIISFIFFHLFQMIDFFKLKIIVGV